MNDGSAPNADDSYGGRTENVPKEKKEDRNAVLHLFSHAIRRCTEQVSATWWSGKPKRKKRWVDVYSLVWAIVIAHYWNRNDGELFVVASEEKQSRVSKQINHLHAAYGVTSWPCTIVERMVDMTCELVVLLIPFVNFRDKTYNAEGFADLWESAWNKVWPTHLTNVQSDARTCRRLHTVATACCYPDPTHPMRAETPATAAYRAFWSFSPTGRIRLLPVWLLGVDRKLPLACIESLEPPPPPPTTAHTSSPTSHTRDVLLTPLLSPPPEPTSSTTVSSTSPSSSPLPPDWLDRKEKQLSLRLDVGLLYDIRRQRTSIVRHTDDKARSARIEEKIRWREATSLLGLTYPNMFFELPLDWRALLASPDCRLSVQMFDYTYVDRLLTNLYQTTFAVPHPESASQKKAVRPLSNTDAMSLCVLQANLAHQLLCAPERNVALLTLHLQHRGLYQQDPDITMCTISSPLSPTTATTTTTTTNTVDAMGDADHVASTTVVTTAAPATAPTTGTTKATFHCIFFDMQQGGCYAPYRLECIEFVDKVIDQWKRTRTLSNKKWLSSNDVTFVLVLCTSIVWPIEGPEEEEEEKYEAWTEDRIRRSVQARPTLFTEEEEKKKLNVGISTTAVVAPEKLDTVDTWVAEAIQRGGAQYTMYDTVNRRLLLDAISIPLSVSSKYLSHLLLVTSFEMFPYWKTVYNTYVRPWPLSPPQPWTRSTFPPLTLAMFQRYFPDRCSTLSHTLSSSDTTSPSTLNLTLCGQCFESPSDILLCPCRRIAYCNKKCQADHWKIHKPTHAESRPTLSSTSSHSITTSSSSSSSSSSGTVVSPFSSSSSSSSSSSYSSSSSSSYSSSSSCSTSDSSGLDKSIQRRQLEYEERLAKSLQRDKEIERRQHESTPRVPSVRSSFVTPIHNTTLSTVTLSSSPPVVPTEPVTGEKKRTRAEKQLERIKRHTEQVRAREAVIKKWEEEERLQKAKQRDPRTVVATPLHPMAYATPVPVTSASPRKNKRKNKKKKKKVEDTTTTTTTTTFTRLSLDEWNTRV